MTYIKDNSPFFRAIPARSRDTQGEQPRPRRGNGAGSYLADVTAYRSIASSAPRQLDSRSEGKPTDNLGREFDVRRGYVVAQRRAKQGRADWNHGCR